jgi:hypothetical protein
MPAPGRLIQTGHHPFFVEIAVTTDNIAEFNVIVLRAIAILYKAHPVPVSLAADQLTIPLAKRGEEDYVERMEVVQGTLRWLQDNGFVKGTLDTNITFAPMLSAQLRAFAYRIVSAKEPNAVNQTLGEAVVNAALQPGSREETVVSELVVRRLLGA